MQIEERVRQSWQPGCNLTFNDILKTTDFIDKFEILYVVFDDIYYTNKAMCSLYAIVFLQVMLFQSTDPRRVCSAR